MIRPDVAVGISVYGNGGMNTDYPGGQIGQMSACASLNQAAGPYNLLCGNGSLGVDLTQLMIAPYVAWKFTPGNSIGIAPVIAYQRFKADGLQAFDNQGLSTSPGNVTNRETTPPGATAPASATTASSTEFSVGIAYSTKMNMDNFEKYAGLFAQGGGFDIPSNWTAGIAFRPTSQWLLALDWERIYYSDAASVSEYEQADPQLLRRAGERLPGRIERRRLRLAGHRRLEIRRAVHAGRPTGRCARATTTATTRSSRRT